MVGYGKPKHFVRVHQALNNFDNKLNFIIDIIQNVVPHFLDLETRSDGTALFKKPNSTNEEVNYSSNVPLVSQVAWIITIVTSTKNICSPIYRKYELDSIPRFVRGMVFQNM